MSEQDEFSYFYKKLTVVDYFLILLLIFFSIIGLITGFLSLVIVFILLTELIKIRKTEPEEEIKETFLTNYVSLKSDYSYLLLILVTIVSFVIYVVNFLTFQNMPLYSLRLDTLRNLNPGIPDDQLWSKSTFNLFGLLMDSVIILILIYVIALRLLPGKQPLENSLNVLFSNLFFVLFLSFSIFLDLIGHTYFEFYAYGQWGTGYTAVIDWFGFDKVAHLFASLTMSVAITIYLSRYLKDKLDFHSPKSSMQKLVSYFFLIVSAFGIAVLLGNVWEFLEWALNIILNLGHFVDEVMDTPKDLVYDFGGSFIGVIMATWLFSRNKGVLKFKRSKTPST